MNNYSYIKYFKLLGLFCQENIRKLRTLDTKI